MWDLSVLQLFVFAIFVILLVRWLTRVAWQIKHFPPGPWGLPIVGYLPWLDEEAYVTFDQLRKKYGSIFSVKMGNATAVILADWSAVKAALVDKSQIFSGRPSHLTFDTASKRLSVSFNDGPIWKNQRRLVVKCLRNVGMGRKEMELLVTEPATKLCELLSKKTQQVVEVEHLFFKLIFPVVWKMVTSRHFDEGNEEDTAFEAMVDEIMQGMRANNPVNFLPWLRFIPNDIFGFHKFIDTNRKVRDYLLTEIKKRMETWQPGQEDNVIDHYLTAMKEHEQDPNARPEGHLNIENLASSLWDLFVAGADTSTTTMQWALLFLALWPEAKKKAQEEIDRVIGRDRLPILDDFQEKRLPYVEATIMEVHRLASIVPLSLAHCPLETTELMGYTIPKRTPCFQNIYSIHHDPQLWDEPEKFNPARFIGDDNEVKWPPYLMPYSIGPRICVGENFAQQELRLLFSHLLQKFDFSLLPDRPKPSLKPIISLVNKPQPYSLIFTVR